MAATIFLSPSPTIPKTITCLSFTFNSSSHSYTAISSSLSQKPSNCPKPTNYPSNSSTINSDFKVPVNPISRSDVVFKMPTAPWMSGPHVLQPQEEVIEPSKPRSKNPLDSDKDEKSESVLTDKLVGRRGKRAIKNIVQSIENLGQHTKLDDTQKDSEELRIGDCFERLGQAGDSRIGGKMPWERDERVVFRRVKKDKKVTIAELSLDKELLDRLRGEAGKMRTWVKVMKAGVTPAVVDAIRSIWKTNELAMVKFDIPLCRNMDRAEEILEIKTGGLIVWRRKDVLVIYRGCNYKSTLKSFPSVPPNFAGSLNRPSSDSITLDLEKGNSVSVRSYEDSVDEKMNDNNDKNAEKISMMSGIHLENKVNSQLTNSSLYEREGDRLLDGLGPRFADWWMRKPLPVDADLLSDVVPGFRPPLRRCPPYMTLKLTDNELTYLRKLARSLPFHFVLGRNRKLQGLAAAILKLWNKSIIVKIALKMGVPNTNNEQMAYELKHLTGGTLLLRNKFVIILYRGKDFLPCGVSDSISEREIELEKCQLHEECARMETTASFNTVDEPQANFGSIGTLSEFLDIQIHYSNMVNGIRKVNLQSEIEKERLEKELRNQERRLFILDSKIKKSALELSKLDAAWAPREPDADKEILTDEERECFKRIGLKMHGCLVLGRRGIFDGVIEGLHQHWKHKEVANIITMQRRFQQVTHTANLIEAESGGILVSVEKLKEGHAIIIYRGKNYRRPVKVAYGNLLTKRKALLRSLEMQRLGSLKFFAYQRKLAIADLKLKLAYLQDASEVD